MHHHSGQTARHFGLATAARATLIALAAMGVHASAQAQNYAKGLSLIPNEEYEALPAVPRFRAFLPPSADLSEWLPAVGDQGEQSSCTAWSTTYYMRSYYVNRAAGNAARPQSLSPAFVYNQLAPRGARCAEGLAIGRVLDFLKNRGAPPYASFPYAMSSCDALPDQTVEQQASNFRIRDWKRLERGKLDDVKGEIAAGNPVVIGMLLPPSFSYHKGSAPFDDITPSPDAHAMTVIGYDDNRRAFRLINSWGTAWGDRGYAWVSYRAFQSDVREAYAARVAMPPPPAPLPAPVVVPVPPRPVVAVVEPPKPAPVPPPVVVPPVVQPVVQPVVPPVVTPPKPAPAPVVVAPVVPPNPVIDPRPTPLPPVVEPPKPQPAPLVVDPRPQPVVVAPPAPEPKPVVEPPKPVPPAPVVVVQPPKPEPKPVVEPPKPVPPAPVVVVQPPKPEPKPEPKPVVEPPKPVPAPVVIEPPKPTLKEIEQSIAKLSTDMRCADVRVTSSGGLLTVSGFVGEQSDAAKLREVLAQAGKAGQYNVQHRPWPQCEALLTLAKPLEESAGLALSTSKAQLREGDALSFQVTTPGYAAYLYVSYLQADGQVVHLRRYADQGNKPLPAGTRITLGGKGEYVVSGPAFGQESVVVVASAIPLLALDRPQEETEREYLTEFRLAILAQQQVRGRVSAAFLPLSTSKR